MNSVNLFHVLLERWCISHQDKVCFNARVHHTPSCVITNLFLFRCQVEYMVWVLHK